MASFLGKILSISLGVYAVAYVLIGALTNIFTNAFTSWDAASKALFTGLLALGITFGIVIMVLREAGLEVSL